jgi:colanic acid/amylovoran biosynthesis glycosyltransferase
MSLRLGYMVPEFPGQTHVFFWREVETLRQLGADVRIVSTKRPTPFVCRHAFGKEALVDTHYLYPPQLSSLGSWIVQSGSGLARAREYLAAIVDRQSIIHRCGLLAAAIDLIDWARQNGIEHIHGHSCANSAHILALANAMVGLPYSLTLHGDLEVYGTDHGLKMKSAKFVSAVGEHLVRQIVQRVGIPPDHVFSTLMGLDVGRLAPAAKARKYSEGPARLITVARLAPTKGHVYALQAIAKARAAGLEIHYAIVGEGPHREALTAVIEELDLRDHATLVGSLSEEEVFRQLESADIFILPSFGAGEAWPVAVMEAMAVGMPVIATRIGATEEMVEDGCDGFLVAQCDSEAIVSKIMLLTRDHNLRERIGRNARATAMRNFEVQNTSRVLLDAISRSM